MTRGRIAAAIAAVITALLLQASVVAPVAFPATVSLPAVLVAVVALTEGPGPGIALGFSAGLLADLCSRHPVGVLALCWMALGVLCGSCAGAGSRRREVIIAALATTALTICAQLLLIVVGADGATGHALLHGLAPTLFGDAILAGALVPLLRALPIHKARTASDGQAPWPAR